MTTSSPAVPRLDAMREPGARHNLVEFERPSRSRTHTWWPASDLGTILLVLTVLCYLPLSVLPGNLHVLLTRSPASPLTVASFCTFLFWVLGVYSSAPSPLNIRETEQLLRAMSVVAVVTIVAGAQLELRLGFCAFVAATLIALLLLGQRHLVRRLLLSPGQQMRALIYARQLDGELLNIVHTMSGHRIEFAGLIDDSPWERRRHDEKLCPFVGTLESLAHAAKQTGASHVFIVGRDIASAEVQHILQKCERLNLQCSILLDPRSLCNTRPNTFVHELPVLQPQTVDGRTYSLDLKRAIDVAIGLCLSLLALPIGIIIAAIIKCDSRGPVFFRQQRIGKQGRVFELLKFRSMHADSPKYHRSPTSHCDPRITRAGRLLRRLSLDELPQLLNVLRGDMSLVGPRPEMPFIVDEYDRAARARLAVRPGITGLWQISRARSMPIHHSLQYDLFYIEYQNVFLDAAILLGTVAAVVRGIGAA